MMTEPGAEEAGSQELAALLDGLEHGSLSPEEQQRLGGLGPLAMIAAHQRYSGPLPRADELNGYDENTRRIIVQMAVDEQRHAHKMRERALEGGIGKDRRGQIFGLVIALTGLAVAGFMSIFSPTAAAFFGAIDLLGMVAVFVAPRVLESRGRAVQVEGDGD